jgi:heme acquisition protein HasR
VSRKSIGAFEKGKRGNAASDSPGSESLTHGTSLLSAQDQQSALLKGTWRFAPGHQLKLSYIGFDAKFDEGPAVRQESLAVTHNHIQTNTLLANYDWRPAGSTLLDLKSSVYYTRTRNQAQRGVGTLDTNEYQLQYQTSTVGGTLQNSARFSVPHADVLLKTGGEFFHDWTDPQAQSLSAGADAGTTALYAGATPAGKRTVASLFGEASLLHSDWLEVTGGLRYDWYGMNGSGRMRVGSIANPGGVRPGTTVVYSRFNVDRHDGAFSPKLSVAIKPVQPIQLFASIGQGMRPPALTEALLWGSHSGSLFPYYPNPNVRAERSTNWEVGANGIFRNLATRADSLRVKAAWFDSRVKNYITLGRIMSPISESGGGALGPYAYVNLDDPFRTRGLELQADYDAGTVFGGVSYTHSLIDTGKGGYNPFPLGSLVGYPANSLGAPADANIWYVLPPRKNLSLSGGVRLLERRLVLGARMRLQSPSANTSMWTSGGDKSYNQQSWRLFDLWASFEATRNTTVRLAVNNLRDTNYAEMQGSTYFVGPGRTVTATVSVKF